MAGSDTYTYEVTLPPHEINGKDMTPNCFHIINFNCMLLLYYILKNWNFKIQNLRNKVAINITNMNGIDIIVLRDDCFLGAVSSPHRKTTP